jgi:Protein of unknown function (DUF3562)
MTEKSLVNNGAHRDEKEDDQHAHAIQRLAQELHMSAEEIRPSYMGTLAVLRKDAKIKAFLPVLISRSIKERLQRR